MTTTIQVRPARREDCAGILAIYNDAVLTTTATYDYEPRTLPHRREWFDHHQEIGFPIFVATDHSGRIVGWSALNRYHDRAGYRFTTENSIYIAPDHRGQGIGKLLLAPLIEGAKKLGLRAIIAAIDGDNQASIRLHARFGFETVGRFKQVGYKFDRWLDVIYMELLLSADSPEILDRASRPTVLILCTGNSCRSHLAEGILRAAAGDRLNVQSAGSNPTGYVHPLAIQVMAEIGIDITRHHSKHMNDFLEQSVETVITVCGNADQVCPTFPGRVNRHHWPFDDPAKTTGTEEEKVAVFRRVRDEIRRVFEAYADGRRDQATHANPGILAETRNWR